MTDPNAQPPHYPVLTKHALKRFRERIQALSDEDIQKCCNKLWETRKTNKSAHTRLVTRDFKGETFTYLQGRAPNNRLCFFALSLDRTAAVTVLSLAQWNFIDEATPKTELEMIIRKVQEAEKVAEAGGTSALG